MEQPTLWTKVQACIHLHDLLTSILLLQVSENEVSGCARSLLCQHPSFSSTRKREEELELLRNRFCSSSAFARASAQESLSSQILSVGGCHVISQEGPFS